MSEGKQIAKNVIIVLFSELVASLLGFVYFALAARYFGALNFGVFSLVIAVNSFLTIFINFGISTLVTRDVARNKYVMSKIIWSSLILKFVFGLGAFVILALYLKLFFHDTDKFIVFYLILISTIISSIRDIFESVSKALEKLVYMSIGRMIYIILLLAGLYVTIILKLDLIKFSIIYILASSVILLFFLFAFREFMKIRDCFNINFNYLIYILKESWPFAITYAFTNIYIWTDSIMLSIFKNELDVGYYSVAYRMVLALSFITVAFNASIYPVLSRYYTSKPKKSINIIIEKYFSIMSLLGIPIGVGTTLLANKIIGIVFGPEYYPAAIALKILIWSLVFSYISCPFVKLFESINMQILVTKITGISALINIIINYLLIPRYSIIGASVATLITEAIVAISLMLFAIKMNYFKFNYISILKVIIGSLLMGSLLKLVNDWNIAASVASAFLLYMMILYLLDEVKKDDLMVIKSIIK